MDARLPRDVFHREALPGEAASLADEAFLTHCRRGRTRMTLLSDVLIGAHAAMQGHALLTRDRGRFRTVELSAPDRDVGRV